MNNQGSTWKKWDLHVHSPFTHLNNEYEDISIEEFAQRIKALDISVVGLTDYFNLDVSKYQDIKDSLNQKGVVVFPNVELRVQPKNKENEELHIHLIFSDVLELKKINAFLGRLKTIDGHYCNNLTQEQLNTTFIGYDTLMNTLQEDTDIIYLRDYIIGACPRGDGSFRPIAGDGRSNNHAQVIDEGVDVLFGNSDDTAFFLNTERYQGAKAKPVFSCSDAHKLETIGGNFTWVKANSCFEGLKQTLWEPQSRIRIQERNPSDEKSNRISIELLKYKDSKGEEEKVYLNKDLNSIIGIRGSGKSTLIKNIAFSVDPYQFEERDKVGLYELEDFHVVWADGEIDSGSEDSPKSLFYIPQNYLSLLSYDESGKADTRDRFLTDLLKKNAKFSNALKAYKDYSSDNKVKIEGLIESLLKEEDLVKEICKELKKQGSLKEIKEEISKKEEEIKGFKNTKENQITDEEIKTYTDAKQTLVESENFLVVLNQDKDILSNIQDTGTKLVIDNQEISRLSTERQANLKTELIKKSKQGLEFLIKEELKTITKEISTKKKEIKEASKKVKKLESKIKANKAIESIAKELGELQKSFTLITELNESLEAAIKNKKEAIDSLVTCYESFDTQQEAIFDTIEFDENFSFLKIDIVTKYNRLDLKKFIDRYINTVSTSPNLSSDDPDLRKLFSDKPNRPDSGTVKKFIKKLLSSEIVLKVEAEGVGVALSQLLKDRREIDFLNSVKTKDEETPFRNMTGGQKAISMLELIFRFDNEKYPILIDQPEDDLDVSGVATDLVNFIKEEKEQRQIIVVSHNASLVVCSDTEQIVVSSCKKVKENKYDFNYNTGAIENPRICNAIIQILEGGRDALRKRAQKLDFKQEL